MRSFAFWLRCCAILLAASCLFAQSPALVEKSHRAHELMAAGKYEEAIPIYQDLARALPHNPGMILNLGMALHMAGRQKQAVPVLEKVLKLDPASLPANLYLGYAYLSLDQPAKAVAPLEKAVHAAPDDNDARENLANALLATDHFEEAAGQFRSLSESNPQSAEAWYGLGRSYEGLSQRSYEKLGELALGSAYWLVLAANARMKDQQFSSAFYLYRQALAKHPKLRGAHAALAEIYRKTGHTDWAEAETAREQNIAAPDCKRDELECDFVAGRYAKVAVAPAGTPEAIFWKTQAFNDLAVQAFARLAQHPDSVEYHELMARIHTTERESRQAVDEWRKAYQLSGQNPQVGTKLAVALIQVQDNQGAQNLVEEILGRQPDSAALNYLLGYARLNLQEPRKAIPSLEKALRLDPGLLPAQQKLAAAYLQTGESGKAIPHLKAALLLDQDGSIHYQLARAYQSSGHADLAKAVLKEYQEIVKAAAAENKATEQEVQITPPE